MAHLREMARSLSPRSRCGYAFWLLEILLACGIAHAAGEARQPSSAVAALTTSDYIERFVQYVRWPAEQADTPWRVCSAPASTSNEADYVGRMARGRGFRMTRIEAPDTARECHILDLTGSTPADAQHFLDAVRGAPVLTVGTGASFCSAGGIVCFLPTGPHPFEINVSAVRHAGLVVNSRLLNLGRGQSAQTQGGTQ